MTLTTGPSSPPGGSAASDELVTFTIDGIETSVPRGTLVIRAAEQLGIAIPRFCDHPLLEPAGACRQCLVEVAVPDREGTLRPMPKPQTSCTLAASPGMVVETQHTSPVADKAQHGIMELLLLNHPLDCPICDKGGECPLQNQAMSNGHPETRLVDAKRTFAKPVRISAQILLDRERCILCQRCTRFSQEIAGDAFIDLQERGIQQQIGRFDAGLLHFAADSDVPTEGAVELDESGEPFSSYFSGNTIQICPVGALTGAAYRFRARPYDLVSSPTVCEHCASGCAVRADHRRGAVMRRLAGEDPAVNEEWSCDKGRWGFTYASLPDRVTVPLVRDEDGELVETSWPDALDVAARGLLAARDGAPAEAAGADGALAGGAEAGQPPSGVGVLVGGRVTVEDAYAYAKFARTALGTNDVDYRARPGSAEEEAFLGHAVAGTGIGLTYADLERASAVVLAGLEPEEESPIVFLRLRKAARHGLAVHTVAPWTTRGTAKLGARLVRTAPGGEAAVLDALAAPASGTEAATATAAATGAGLPAGTAEAATALRGDGAVLLVGERLAEVPGALSAAVRAAEATGARLAWVPRRAGERGAVEAGALPGLLPGGRPVADAAARVDVAAAWDVDAVPVRPGRDTPGILDAARDGAALLVGGVDPDDLPDPAGAREALARAGFVVSLELRRSAVTEHADVVLPVAPVAEKAGAFLDWEGRLRPFEPVLDTDALADHEVLDELAAAMGSPIGAATTASLREELASIGGWDGHRIPAPAAAPAAPVAPPAPGSGQVVLATWHHLLDAGRGLDGERHLAGIARRAVARLGAATAAAAGLDEGDAVRLTGPAGDVVLPVALADLPDGVVWLPTRSRGCEVRRQLGAGTGEVVGMAPAAITDASGGDA